MKRLLIFLCFLLSTAVIADSDYTVEEVYSLIKKGMSLKELKGLGFHINKQYDFGQTLLHHAAYKNDSEIIKVLLEAGADKKISSTWGGLPLHGAVQFNSVEAIKILVDEETVNMETKNQSTPLLSSSGNPYSAMTKNYIKIVQILIENGANKDALDKDGNTILHRAATVGFPNLVKFLLEEGFDRHIQNQKNKTPLDLAKEQGFMDYTSEEYEKRNYKETIRLLEEYYPKQNKKENPEEELNPNRKNKNLKILSKQELKERGEVNFSSLITSSQKKKCEESVVSQSVKAKVPK